MNILVDKNEYEYKIAHQINGIKRNSIKQTERS